MIAEIPKSIKFTKKKLALFSYPSHKVAKIPESLLPIEVDKTIHPSLMQLNVLDLTLKPKTIP